MTTLSVWLMDLGIIPVYSDLGHSQGNGRNERMRQDLEDTASRPPRAGGRTQFRTFDPMALVPRTPNEIHRNSVREYSGSVDGWSHPVSMKNKMITVNRGMRWGHEFTMVTTALGGRHLGLEQVQDGVWIADDRSVARGEFSKRTDPVHELEEFRSEG